MFDNLVESRIKKRRSLGQAAASIAVHVALIFAAVKATQGAAEAIRDPVDTQMVYMMKPPEPTPPAAPASPPPSEAVVATNPPPKGFKTISAPIDIPKEIPPIDFNQKPFDPKDFTGEGVEGGSAYGVVGGTGPVDVAGLGGRGSGGVYAMSDLDDPVQPIKIPDPRYPSALKSAGITGRVELQYIVDTTGHAEPNSFKVLTKTHEAFVAPAEEAILKGLFKPAKFRGRPVRQLVQQAVSFTVR